MKKVPVAFTAECSVTMLGMMATMAMTTTTMVVKMVKSGRSRRPQSAEGCRRMKMKSAKEGRMKAEDGTKPG